MEALIRPKLLGTAFNLGEVQVGVASSINHLKKNYLIQFV